MAQDGFNLDVELAEIQRHCREVAIGRARKQIEIEESVRLRGWKFLSEWEREVIFQIRMNMLLLDSRMRLGLLG